MPFTPDYRHLAAVRHNLRPERLPLYEHLVNPGIMGRILGVELEPLQPVIVDGALRFDPADLALYFTYYWRFFRELTYDVASFEVCVTEILPEHGALSGGRPGPIQSRADFERYPWAELPERYRRVAAPQFEALLAATPPGMAAIGGVGNGVFEIAEDLVGLEYLPFMQADDPPLYDALFRRIGDLLVDCWAWFLPRYAHGFVGCRMGDDLGFKASLLTNPRTVREQILPQYRRIIAQVHAVGKPFLWHSCGNILSIMEDAIAAGIDAKHSNEDAIAPFDQWIAAYGQRIGLLGGFDLGLVCTATPEELFARAVEDGRRFRATAQGYALGSGNSIPDYVPVDNYLALVRAAQTLRAAEGD